MRLSGLGKKTLAEFIRRHGNGRGKRLFYQRIESGQLKSMVLDEPEVKQEIKIEEVVEQPKSKRRKKSLLSQEEE